MVIVESVEYLDLSIDGYWGARFITSIGVIGSHESPIQG